MLQLACQWTLGNKGVKSVVPTLIQEHGEGARTIESKLDDLAALPEQRLTLRMSRRSARSVTTPAAWLSKVPASVTKGRNPVLTNGRCAPTCSTCSNSPRDALEFGHGVVVHLLHRAPLFAAWRSPMPKLGVFSGQEVCSTMRHGHRRSHLKSIIRQS
jgi:hypothetical protein